MCIQIIINNEIYIVVQSMLVPTGISLWIFLIIGVNTQIEMSFVSQGKDTEDTSLYVLVLSQQQF